MKVLGIIPARGGSKGVPKKNIREIDGKPLISYSIEVGKKSKLLTNLIVSTDSEEIIKVSNNYNCRALKRSADNSMDETPIEPVILEVLNNIEEKYDLIVLLQPTAPIRETEDIDNVIRCFINDAEIESVVSVVELEDIHPARMYNLSETNELLPINPSSERKRRQDLESVYIRNGAIYAIRVDSFLKNQKLITANKIAYVMPESKWANIDTERDVLIAEVLISEWKKGNL